jgi:hypothetical protein
VKRVLIDRHHHALFYSLQRLFEDRLGCLVYTPVGHEWWDEGYWRFGEGYGDDRLARQFLSLDGWAESDLSQSPGSRMFRTTDGHHPERPIRGVELGRVLKTPGEWTYVVATVQDNQRGFHRLAQELTARKREAHLSYDDTPVKYVLQVGNTNQSVDWSLDPLALVSSEVPIKGRGIVYHQEFDAEGTFGYADPEPSPLTIRSFVNCFPSTYVYPIVQEVQAAMPEATFGIHGIDGPDGNIETVADIARLMRESTFGWHDKVQGDGFGHVLHDWAAVGRPLIGHGSFYRGLMGEVFWQDGVTCIDLDKHTTTDVVSLIRDIHADPERHREMCRAIRRVFDETVDFAAEAERIREFLV